MKKDRLMQIDVSVVVPIYNVEKYLETCLESIVAQTLKTYEVILVNDGSTDNSIDIAKKYVEKYDNFILINQDNKGLSGARNTGLRHAKGKYVYFCDSDDYIESKLLEICYEQCETNNLEVVLFNFHEFYDGILECNFSKRNVEISSYINSEKVMDGKFFFKTMILKCGLSNVIWRQFYNRSFLQKNNFEFVEGILHEDMEFTPRILMNVERIKFINKKLYYWRRRSNSITTATVDYKVINSLKYILDNNFILMKKNISIDKELDLSFKKYLHNIMAFILYKIELMNCSSVDKKNITTSLVKEFIESYMNIIGNSLSFSDYISIQNYIEFIIINCNGDLCAIKEILIKNMKIEIDNNIIKDLNRYIIEYRNALLRKLPLDKDKNMIGIYGVGDHTYRLIRDYERYIGKIKAQIFFIDTCKGTNKEQHFDRPIINLYDINNFKLDAIILSSLTFEDEIYNNLKNVLIKNVPIFRFYENEWRCVLR